MSVLANCVLQSGLKAALSAYFTQLYKKSFFIILVSLEEHGSREQVLRGVGCIFATAKTSIFKNN